mgnify:CR=1 FL=1
MIFIKAVRSTVWVSDREYQNPIAHRLYESSDCSSMPELVIEGQGGHLCELGNCRAYADAINTLADSRDTRKTMGEFNRERAVRLFSLDKMVTAYKDLFERVLS